MIIATTWLCLAFILCGMGWFINRRLVLFSLPASCLIAAVALWIPTGSPRFTKPPQGDYVVVGAKIVVDKAIYVLLDTGDVPTYYVLPYSTAAANQLQDALDARNGEGVAAHVKRGRNDEGVSFDGPPPVSGNVEKRPETPVFQ